MLLALSFAAAISGVAADELSWAMDNYRKVQSYVVTIHSSGRSDLQDIRYSFKKPGFVRMDFIYPHNGTVLIYSPVTGRVSVWPFGIHHFPKLNLSPNNSLIQGSGGQRIDHSDIGALFDNIYTMALNGTIENRAIDSRNLHLVITGADKVAIGTIHRYELWLDPESGFPRKVISYDLQNRIIETVIMDVPTVNIQLPEVLFTP